MRVFIREFASIGGCIIQGFELKESEKRETKIMPESVGEIFRRYSIVVSSVAAVCGMTMLLTNFIRMDVSPLYLADAGDLPRGAANRQHRRADLCADIFFRNAHAENEQQNEFNRVQRDINEMQI